MNVALRALLLLSLVCGLALPLAAQESAAPQAGTIDLEFLRLHARTRGFSLGRPAAAQPTPDGKAVLFLRAADGQRPASHLFEFNVETKAVATLLTPEQLTAGRGEEQLSPEERARRERQRTAGARGFASFQIFPDASKLLIPYSGKLYVFQRGDRSVTELKTGPGVLDPKISPDGQWIGYVRDHDVYVLELATNTERRVTTGGTADVSHGLAEFVAQEEMNRFSGWWWAPDSQAICYQESDARAVETWHVADPSRPGSRPSAQRYPRPGKANVRVRLGIIPRTGGETTWLKWDAEKFPYFNTLKWPRLDRLTLVVQDRLQHTQQVLLADPKTGETHGIHSATDDAWLNIDQSVPLWLKDGSAFLWTTDQDDGKQLELIPAAGGPPRILIAAKEGFAGLLDLNDNDSATEASPGFNLLCYLVNRDSLDRHVARATVTPQGVQLTRLTRAPGIHTAALGKHHDLFVHRVSGPKQMPTASVIRTADGEVLGELPSVAQEPPFWPTTHILQVGDNPRWNASITRPRQFDARRKYPVIVQVYGGPTVQTVTPAISSYFLQQWYADHGFIVVAIDNRGTPGRGRAWERAIYRDFGQLPLDDQVAALKLLGAKFPEMDLGRVGIKGWSFGGYMSALAVLKRPDVFHAAVAGAPVTEWEDYDTHYTERYLALPKDNVEGYKNSSLLPLAKKLTRPLLLVHGSADDNVYFIHSLKLADALFRNGQPFELLVMKGQAHGVVDPQLRERLEERTLRFMQQHLAERK